MRELFVEKVIDTTGEFLDNNQRIKLKEILTEICLNYHIEMLEQNQKQEIQKNNEEILNKFISSKEIEGCSVRTLKYYKDNITKIIKQDARYNSEKLYRKNLSNKKRKIDKNKYIKNKRELKRIEDNYSIVQAQHNQASRELSKSNHLSNESYRKWNYSAYKYNSSKRRYEFDEKLGRSYDIPKYIKER